MNKKLFLSFIILAFISFSINTSYGQKRKKDPVLLTIGDENISLSEFEKVYQKNNTEGQVIDKKTVREYLQLYINYKLKVIQAKSLGMDTLQSFKNELAGYRKQLAESYLMDEKMNEKLLKEAYKRKKIDLRASHILIKIAEDAVPEDTLVAYNKIRDARKRIVAGEIFEDVAAEVSEDPSVKDRDEKGRISKGNKGDLGYFTVFDMVYPFETAAYNLKEGVVSKPVRTAFGYHLIKITDRKAAIGRVQVAHIMLVEKEGGKSKKEIAMKAFERIQSGEEFSNVAKELSDDKTSAAKGGVLPWFGVNRVLPDIIYEVSQLKDLGDITKPFKTVFGWHIMKLLDQKKPDSFEDEKMGIKQKMNKNDRSLKSKKELIKKIKKENKFKENKNAVEQFYAIIDESIMKGKWEKSNASHLNDFLFSIGKKTYTQKDLSDFIDAGQKRVRDNDLKAVVNKFYRQMVDEKCVAYEDSQLENKHPEFRDLMKEYNDGILLFDLSQKKVWQKAGTDSIGLKKFFKENRKNYIWAKRADAVVYETHDTNIIAEVLSMIEAKKTDDEIFAFFNDKKEGVEIMAKMYAPGDNDLLDMMKWYKGSIHKIKTNQSFRAAYVYDVLYNKQKTFDEVKNLLISDYQKKLEKDWLIELRKKYPVTIKSKLLRKI